MLQGTNKYECCVIIHLRGCVCPDSHGGVDGRRVGRRRWRCRAAASAAAAAASHVVRQGEGLADGGEARRERRRRRRRVVVRGGPAIGKKKRNFLSLLIQRRVQVHKNPLPITLSSYESRRDALSIPCSNIDRPSFGRNPVPPALLSRSHCKILALGKTNPVGNNVERALLDRSRLGFRSSAPLPVPG